jgi:hypothetical protein
MPSDVDASTSAQPSGTRHSWTIRPVVLVILSDLIVIVFYVWLITVGTWSRWPTITAYYDQLATAFQHGQLSLDAKPDPALLALPNPYDPAARGDVPYPLDFSLYKGKFYLYFGPAPALVLVLAKLVIPGTIGDQYLVFTFIAGIFLVESLFIYRIWRRFFSESSPAFLVAGQLALGLTSPFTWMLGQPKIYAAAIMAGQFFFLAGLYSAFIALDRAGMKSWPLILSGVFFAAAVGSRITQVISVMATSTVIVAWIFKRQRGTGPPSGVGRPLLAFALPLLAGAGALAWYNWARFGLPTETGFTYQLTAWYLRKYIGQLVSPVYVFQNLYIYLLNPPTLKYTFPYFRPLHGPITSILPFVRLPAIYLSQEITGLAYDVPYVILALGSLLPLIKKRSEKRTAGSQLESLKWPIVALWVSFTMEFGFFLSFFWSSERYFADFLPALLILSVVGFWASRRALERWPLVRFLHLLVAIGLVVTSITVSGLLALSLNSAGFRKLNPLLWRELSNLFRP